MRQAHSIILAVLVLLGVAPTSRGDEAFAWRAWRNAPVLDGGRVKPLDSLARETLRGLANRAEMTDPIDGQHLDACAFYLVLLLDWQGWSEAETQSEHPPADANDYFAVHRPDKWDQTALLRVDNLELRRLLKWDSQRKLVSPVEVHAAKLVVPATGRESSLLRWTQELAKQEAPLTKLEQDAVQLADRFRAYVDHRMGKRLFLLAPSGSDADAWTTAAALLTTRWNDASDPTGQRREAQAALRAVRNAYLRGSAADFNAASQRFFAARDAIAADSPASVDAAIVDLEVAFHDWAPFRIAWVFTLVSCVSLLLAHATHWRIADAAGWLTFGAGVVALIAGFAMRVIISGRAPVTNMYESVVFVAAGVALFGMVLEALYRKRYVLAAAAAVTTLALVVADNSPVVLDASIAPLQPVLRNNFWLVTHVMTITLSYAALALALGLGNIALGYFLVGSPNKAAIDNLTNLTYRAIQLGVLLLAAGTILGGVWADYSWGRFWGWDPKEVWALVTLLGYLAVLHARFAGWVHQFGLAALAVLCFPLVVMAWYGVNFVLGAGLHSYGFGESHGAGYVALGVLIQALYVLAAAVCHAAHRRNSGSHPTTVALAALEHPLAPSIVGARPCR
ncbi:MAG: hypothetical protein DCC68_03490 [Planctomycetota bacterium]|nr:MAG: hypothetical protein DCC68_03490 [Planctomycetota bacterium]